MATTLLIRHAQASFGAETYDRLSALGVQQARLAGEYLASAAGPVERIVCGQLVRQQTTAAEIAARVRTAQGDRPAIEVDARLDELDIDAQIERVAHRLNDPDKQLARDLEAARSSSRAYQRVIRRVFAHWQTLAEEPGSESWLAFSARTQAAVSDIARRSRAGGTTIAVSSGAVIATVVHGLLGLPAAGAYPLFEAMKNCSITQLLHTRERVSLASFNETAYLSAMGVHVGNKDLITYR